MSLRSNLHADYLMNRIIANDGRAVSGENAMPAFLGEPSPTASFRLNSRYALLIEAWSLAESNDDEIHPGDFGADGLFNGWLTSAGRGE
jgi:hypothetical protein